MHAALLSQVGPDLFDSRETSVRILFVCMGNICRSPSAAGVFKRVLQQHAPDLAIDIDSAGTHDYHVGEPPDPRALAAAQRRGIDLTQLRARLLEARDFATFDLIVAMDEQNVRELRARVTPGARAQIRLMMDYAPEHGRRAVPDPYYGGVEGFEEVLDLLEQAAAGLLREVLDRRT
jgi:protein-tyrosine phosphatase